VYRYFVTLLTGDNNQTVRHVSMLEGVTVSESTAQKDELILVGNDIDHVSQSGQSSQKSISFFTQS
jgi:hypothetical protein